MKVVLYWVLCALAGLMVVVCLGLGAVPAPVVFLFHLLIGWIGYLFRVMPRVRFDVGTAMTAVVCFAGVVLVGHALARWLWRESAPAEGPVAAPRSPWRFRWTIAGAVLLVLMFASGISAVGVTHQSVWLARSERPMFSRGGRPTADRVKCASNLRQLGQAIEINAKDHDGRLPDSLRELLETTDITSVVLVCPSTEMEPAPGQTPQEQARALSEENVSYVYHGRGLRLPLTARERTVILCEPLVNHDGEGMNILFGDGRVEWLTPVEARRAMAGY